MGNYFGFDKYQQQAAIVGMGRGGVNCEGEYRIPETTTVNVTTFPVPSRLFLVGFPLFVC